MSLQNINEEKYNFFDLPIKQKHSGKGVNKKTLVFSLDDLSCQMTAIQWLGHTH